MPVVPDSPFVGSQNVVVLYPVALEQMKSAAIELNGEMHHQLILRLGKDQLEVPRQFQHLGTLQHD